MWRDYNKRAGCECVIKDLDEDFALPKLILFTPHPQGILASHPYSS